MSDTLDQGNVVDELAAMRAELAELRARLDAKEAAPAAPAEKAELLDLAQATTDRRSLLRKGGIAAAAAAAGGAVVLSQASPAAAANGDPLLIGNNNVTSNQAGAATVLRYTGGNSIAGKAALLVQDDGGSNTFLLGGALVGGVATGGSDAAYGVSGRTTASGRIAGVLAYGAGTGSYGMYAYGDKAGLRIVNTNVPPLTRSDSHVKGEIDTDNTGSLWTCVADGTPGTWRKLAGPTTAGALHILPAPVRIYDSRPSAGGPGPFGNLEVRTINAKVKQAGGASGVPTGARGVLVNFTVTNTSSGGYGTLWAADQPDPGAVASVNWGGMAGLTLNNSVLTATDSSSQFKCKIATFADVILDVVGYYQ